MTRWEIELRRMMDDLVEARATVRFHKGPNPDGRVTVVVEVNGTEYEAPTAADALLGWARRKA